MADSGAIAQPSGHGGSSEGASRFIPTSLSNHAMLSMSDQQSTGKQEKNALAIVRACCPQCRSMPACPSGGAASVKTVSIQQQFGETCLMAALEELAFYTLKIRKNDKNVGSSHQVMGPQIGNLPQPKTAV